MWLYSLAGIEGIKSDATKPFDTTAHRLIYLEDQQKTLDLAVEFGFDPLIVQVTRQLSKDVFQRRACKCPTWRFVRSDYDLTYLILSIIAVESRGDYKAYNPSGASGLTQLLLSTAKQYDRDLQAHELFTIPKHLQIAVEHFVDLLAKYHGNAHLAILAWNRGAGAVDRSIALGESPENGYGKLVFTQSVLRNATVN
jgi:hypothetical protein